MLETMQSEDPMLSWDELEDDDEETSYQIFEPTFEGDYAWHGKFDPANYSEFEPSMKHFSVSVFQWKKRKIGPGLKRGHRIAVIKGRPNDPEAVYEKANEVLDWLKAGRQLPHFTFCV